MRSAALVVASMALLVIPSTAGASEYLLTFDDMAAGATVSGGPGGMQLAQPGAVFTVPNGDTQSPPNALRRPGNCPNAGRDCTTGDNRVEFTFSEPARTLEVRGGTRVPSACFELDCPSARLMGFDAAGTVVAATPPTDVSGPLRTLLRIDAGSHVIRRAVYAVAEDPQTGAPRPEQGYEYTAQFDQLHYNVLDPGQPPPAPVPPAPPPSVSISDPVAGQEFATTDITVAGNVSAPAGVADFCVVANGGDAFPERCTNASAIRDGAYSVGRVPGLRPGDNEIRAWVRDTRARTASASVDVRVADGEIDFVAETLEITQAVQTNPLPVRSRILVAPNGLVGGLASYDGVPLARDKTTIVRLFGSARGAIGSVRGTPALLHGFAADGSGRLRELPGSPLRPHGSPDGLVGDPDLAVLRASPAGAWTFVLPGGWTSLSEELVLMGEVAPPSIAAGLRECCRPNNAFAVENIRPTAQRRLRIYPVALPYTDSGGARVTPANPLPSYFDALRAVTPAPVEVIEGLSPVDVTDIVPVELARPEPDGFAAIDRLIDRLRRLYADRGLRGKVVGLLAGGIGSGKGPGPVAVTGSINAFLDFVTHETYHTLGFKHASNACDAGGGSGWPPDERGQIQGVGIDPRFWSGGAPGRFQPIAQETPGVFDATPDAPAQVYDFMSYCSNEGIGETWISTRYWALAVRGMARRGDIDLGYSGGCCRFDAPSDVTVSQDRADRVLRVAALIAPDGGSAEITAVETGEGTASAAAEGSDVEIVVRDAAGAELSRTRVSADALEARPAPGIAEPAPSRSLLAQVPAPDGAASVEVVVRGRALASRTASANAPRVSLKRPRSGARIPGRGSFAVEWTASDPDANPLRSRVEHSADGGHTWKVLRGDLSGSRAQIRGSELARARRGLLRVVVGDGFHARSAVARVRSAGRRPGVSISSPPSGTRMRSDTVVVLTGSAADDAGRPIRGRRLVWRSGRKRLGRGAGADVPAYALRRGRVTLHARDRFGRAGRAAIRLNVQRVAPVLTTLRVSALSRAGRRLRLRLASSIPGSLRISGRGIRTTTFKLGNRVRTAQVQLTRRRASYDVRLRLHAQGRATGQALRVDRAGG